MYNLIHSEIYNSFEQERIRKVISDLVKKKRNLKVLDVGAGTGNLSLKFLDLNCNVTASDVSGKSLKLLKKLSNDNPSLKLVIIKNKKLPFEDNQFDLVCTYSVLHHIPDYLFTINEMIRVCKPGGRIYIDHEVNENRWKPDKHLLQYYKINKQNLLRCLIKLIKTKELFTFDFIRAAFIKIFVNKRYMREGDIHVWKDDHINWDKIKEIIYLNNCNIIKEEDYLMYNTLCEIEIYNEYKNKCSDMKDIIIKK